MLTRALSPPKRSEFDYLPEEVALIHTDRDKREYPLGDKPVIVLTGGKNADEGHQKLQADLVRLSRDSKQIVAQKSGHHIHFDEPELALQKELDELKKKGWGS